MKALIAAAPASVTAQTVVDRGERLSPERPEAWAMAYLSATTLFLGAGRQDHETSPRFWLSAELAQIPRLSAGQRRIGFNGTKTEDLNKSPVFGRLRLGTALPAGFSLELGWTPPVEIDGARPRHLFAAAVSRPLVETASWKLAGRIFHQRGKVVGDFTCDRETASFEPGSARNPYGCRAPSSDTFRMDQTGIELGVLKRHRRFAVDSFASVAYTWMAPSTRVNARTFGVIDRSLLSARLEVPTVSLGLRFRPSDRWQVHAALSWTQLEVRRRAGEPIQSDDLYSPSLSLTARFP